MPEPDCGDVQSTIGPTAPGPSCREEIMLGDENQRGGALVNYYWFSEFVRRAHGPGVPVQRHWIRRIPACSSFGTKVVSHPR